MASTRKGHGRVARVMFGGGDAVLGRGGAGAATSDWRWNDWQDWRDGSRDPYWLERIPSSTMAW